MTKKHLLVVSRLALWQLVASHFLEDGNHVFAQGF